MAYKVFQNGFPLNASELNNYLMNQSVMVFATATARDTDLTAPLEGMIVWLQDSNKFVYYTGSAWTDVIVPATTNAIINGAFDIWQRGTSFSGSSQFFYTADRWESGADTTFTVSRQTFTPGSAPVTGLEYPYFFRFAKNSGGTFLIFRQRMEDVRSFAGQTVTVSFYAKADAAANLSIDLSQVFGSGGSATVVTSATAQALTTSWARYSVSVSVPSVSGKTIGTSSYLELQFSRLTSGAWTPDIFGVQVEAGSVATPFKPNSPNLALERQTALRYLHATGGTAYEYHATAIAGNTTTALVTINLKTILRTSPAGVEYANLALYDGASTFISLTNLTMNYGGSGSGQVALTATVASGLTAGKAYWLLNNNNAAGYLRLPVEL